MEEILASIRSIIADDREPAAAQAGAASRIRRQRAADRLFQGRRDASAARRRAAARVEAPPAPVEPLAPKVVWSQPQPQRPRPRAPTPAPAPAAEEEPLLSDQTNQAVSAAFDALSTSLALQSAELAENATREILRPMLKTWLDEHLPSMVERLVRAEIQRVARGGR